MLRARERRILDAFVDSLIPPGEPGGFPSGHDAQVPQRIDRYLLSMPRTVRLAFPLALWAIELYPITAGPGLRPFSTLSRGARTRALERLEGHALYPLRSAFMAVKLLAFMFWAEDDRVARATGWGAHCT